MEKKTEKATEKLTVTPIEHKDVRGKILYYLKVENNTSDDPVLINVGLKTYNGCVELQRRK